MKIKSGFHNISDRKPKKTFSRQEYAEKKNHKLQRLNEDFKKLNETLTQRLAKKITQIDNVARIREKLRRTPDLSTGVELILDSALNDLSFDKGAVLFLDHQNRAIELKGFKNRIDETKMYKEYPLNSGFSEFKALFENKNFSRVIEEGEQSVLCSNSIHCIPILFGKEAKGVLAFGSQDDCILDKSDLAILGLYSELASTLFEAQSLTVMPVQEKTKVTRRFKLEFGCSYLLKGNIKKAFEIFIDNVLSGVKGLCITREFPLKIRHKYGLERTPIVWLTEEKMEDQMTVYSISDLSIMIDRFLDKARKSIVLLDGFEFLIINHGFEHFIRFLGLAKNRFERSASILIAPLYDETLTTRELKLIEREVTPLMAENITSPQIAKGVFRGHVSGGY